METSGTEAQEQQSKPRKSILKNSPFRTQTTEVSKPLYPESVIAVSQMVAEATKEVLSGKNSSSSSSYSSPIGSPTPVTCNAGHCCGSLFGRCAQQQHGKFELLQTFTDPTSPLSKDTFHRTPPPFYRYPTQRSQSLNNGLSQKSCNLPKNFSDDALIKKQQSCHGKLVPVNNINNNIVANNNNNNYLKSSQIILSEDNLNTSYDVPEIQTRIQSNTEESPPPKNIKPILVRRHSSIPNTEQNTQAITDKTRRRSFTAEIKPRPGTPVQDLEFFDGGNEEIRYYIDEDSSSSDGQTDQDQELESYMTENDANQYLINMGNGVANCNSHANQVVESTPPIDRTSKTSYHVNGEYENLDYLRSLVPQMKQKCKDWETKADALETQVLSLKQELKKRDQENMNLQREIHKLRSVLQHASSYIPEGELLTSVQDSHGMPGQWRPVIAAPNTTKKQGVSGESSDSGNNADQIQIERFEKDFRSKQLIKDAIMENDFLKNLDSSQLREIVESMFPKEFLRGSYVIREGEAGSHLYVSAEGELEVIKDNKILGRMGPRKAFGELAILYNCRRTASVKVGQDAKLWVLDRRVFQQIMKRSGLQRLQDNINFLRSVPLLHKLSQDVLSKIADVLEVEFYPTDAHIIRQGANGDTFFIIRQGSVKVTQRVHGRREEDEIRVLTKGDYFGEQALLKEDIRTANVIAISPGVECLTLDRDSFIQLIGDLSELHEKDYGDETRGLSRPSSAVSLLEQEEYDYIHLDDLDVVATLGVGGFGRVELVQYIYDRSLTFALKCLKKQHIVDTQQQEHVYSEKNIMKNCNCYFICRLYKTFRDSKYVYMMLEACLGGEVWTILRDRGCFDDNTTKFITGCVLEAFEYLHARGIIYRDLKPENLLLNNNGYVKLVDFGFSKRLGFSSKTWTFCGTPEYVAPEIILNKGHDRAVDYWSLGVLMHELLTGTPPFTASDPMKTYNIILKGIDMVDFPKNISRAAQSLIKRLCRDAPSERLGYQLSGIQDIKKHKWFQGFHWDGLKQQALVAPIIPHVRGPIDTTNFDCYPKEHDLPADEFSNWDADF